MDQWELQQKNKILVNKIKNVKSNVPKANKKPHSKDTRHNPVLLNESASTQKSAISGLNEDEKLNKDSIPLYKLLKMYQLQQYAQGFISKGYGYDLIKFSQINEECLDSLHDEFKMAPGHKTKFLRLIDFVNSILPSLNKYSSLSSAKSKKVEVANLKSKTMNYHLPNLNQKNINRTMVNQQSPPFSQNQIYKNAQMKLEKIVPERNNSKKKDTKIVQKQETKINKKIKLQSIGIDFFRDSDDIEFDQRLKQIMMKYDEPHELSSNRTKPSLYENQQKDIFSQHMTVEKIVPKEDTDFRKKAESRRDSVKRDDSKKTELQKKNSVKTKNVQSQKPLNYTQQPPLQNIKKSQDSQKLIAKSKSKRAIDDSMLIEQFNGNDQIELQLKPNKLIEVLEKQLQKQPKKAKQEVDLPQDYPNLNIDMIKMMYQSFDSAKLTSTLVNLDIEEMSYCLAEAILKHIQIGQPYLEQDMAAMIIEKQQKHKKSVNTSQDVSKARIMNPMEEPTMIHNNQDSLQLFQSMQNQELAEEPEEYDYQDDENFYHPKYDDDGNIMSNNQKDRKTLGAISEKTFEQSQFNHDSQNKSNKDQFKYSRNQVEQLLKESLIMKAEKQEEEQEQDIEEDFEKENDIHTPSNLPQEPNNDINDDFYQSHYEEVNVDQEEEQNTKQLFYKTFQEENLEHCQFIPSKEVIKDFCKNIIITCKMEKEVTIISLVYIERLLVATSMFVDSTTWRKIMFTSLILASKIWDDESFENQNFSKAFPTYNTTQINQFERVFLQFINYNLYIKSSDYAKYYFILRTYAEKLKKSFPLRPLDLKTILYLQRSANKAETSLRETYSNPLNKSF